MGDVNILFNSTRKHEGSKVPFENVMNIFAAKLHGGGKILSAMCPQSCMGSGVNSLYL